MEEYRQILNLLPGMEKMAEELEALLGKGKKLNWAEAAQGMQPRIAGLVREWLSQRRAERKKKKRG